MSNSRTVSRRKFLGQAGLTIAGATLALQKLTNATAQAQDPSVFRNTRPLNHQPPGTQCPGPRHDALTGVARADQAYDIRVDAAERERNVPIPPHPNNGDEARYPNRIGNFSKGLKHNALGEVDPAAYNAFMSALKSGRFQSFENLRPFLGCPDPARQRPLVNPEAAYGYDLEGTDPAQLAMLPPPAFASAEEAAEMVELYWMALLRDVNFDDYAHNPLALEAASDLSRLSAFYGPKVNGRVTPQTLFRDVFPGCTTGPYISQFLLQQTNFGAQFLDQRIEARAPGTNYMTTFPDWLKIQNGCIPDSLVIPVDPQVPLRFICNGRDISQYVRLDFLYQAYLVASLILMNGITLNETTSPFVFRFPFDAGNPYGPDGSTIVQAGFGTFGNPMINTLVVEPATRALKCVWFEKWYVQRRIRPEAFGGAVEVNRKHLANYPVNPQLARSGVLAKTFQKFGSYLLPQAFPEGSPLHPSYGAGHATVAGACVTMLKAFFDESTVIPDPVVINPADGGATTIPYEGPALTVGGELNKLASNVATGRNHAGIHWRSDAVQSMKLGEMIAIRMLQDMSENYAEPFCGFTLTKLDGTTIKVGGPSRTC